KGRLSRVDLLGLSTQHYRHRLRVWLQPPDRVPQRHAQTVKGYFDQVAVLILPIAVLKAQLAGAEEMDVNIARQAVLWILKMMIFDVGQRMAHVPLAGAQLAGIIDDLVMTKHATAAAKIVKSQIGH